MHISPNTDLTSGLLGGLTIGTASTLLIVFNKRISGMSGIVKTLIADSPVLWASSYVAGLLTSGYFLGIYSPKSFGDSNVMLTSTGVAVSGVLVGFGAALGNGCTSGHGVCGLGRMSARSLVAVCTFMGTAAISAGTLRNNTILYGAKDVSSNPTISTTIIAGLAGTFLLSFAPRIVSTMLDLKPRFIKNTASGKESLSDAVSAFFSAVIFGGGLCYSGMCNPNKVHGFLDFLNTSHGWDPSLMGVMGGAVLFNLLSFNFLNINFGKEYRVVLNMRPPLVVDWKLIAGSALFGIGWGIGGICPGPALVSLGAGKETALLFVPWLLAGVTVQEALFRDWSMESSSKK